MQPISILSAGALLALAAAAHGQNRLPQPEAAFHGSSAGSGYAQSLAVDGDRLVVGEFGASGGPGAAWIYEHIGDAWVQTFLWQPDGAATPESFARCVAIDGSVAVASAANGTATAAFHVLEWDGSAWRQTAHISAPPGEPVSDFGAIVTVSGQRILAANLGTGRVHVYDKLDEVWTHRAVLVAASPPPVGGMGQSLALDVNRAVVGEVGDAGFGPTSGAVHVFDLVGSEWIETAVLHAAQPQAWEWFGAAVDVQVDRIVVGAWGTLLEGSGMGSVHDFMMQGGRWTEIARLQPPSLQGNGSFGSAVALDGMRLVVGEPQNGLLHGRGYVFEDDGEGFELRARFRSLPTTSTEGCSVGLSRDMAVLGAGSGVATIFDVTDEAWADLGGSKAGALGLPALYGYGTLEGGSANTLLLTDALGLAPVMFFLAPGPGSPQPFQGGTLLAFPPIVTALLATPPDDPLHGNQMLVTFRMPADAGGLQLVLQAGVRDQQATHALALSNALLMSIP